MTERLFRSAAALLLAAAIIAAPVAPVYGQPKPAGQTKSAQGAGPGSSSAGYPPLMRGPDYSKGKSPFPNIDRKSTRLNSSHLGISYAVFCLKKKINHK